MDTPGDPDDDEFPLALQIVAAGALLVLMWIFLPVGAVILGWRNDP